MHSHAHTFLHVDVTSHAYSSHLCVPLYLYKQVVLKVLQQVAGGCKPDVVENGFQVLRALEEKVRWSFEMERV
jgi:hypothetical protein